MALITLETRISAPRERVFDLARSIDAHQASAGKTRERAVGGVTSGLISLNEEVTWEAVHFGLTQRLRGRITAFDYPNHFRDEMVDGAFRSLRHDHHFEEADGQTVMTDRFEFFAPYGLIGRAADKFILEPYLRRFLIERNAVLKEMAETDRWREYLGGASG